MHAIATQFVIHRGKLDMISGRGDTRHCKSYLFIAFLNSSRSPDHFAVLNVKKFPKMSEIKNIFVLLVVYLVETKTLGRNTTQWTKWIQDASMFGQGQGYLQSWTRPCNHFFPCLNAVVISQFCSGASLDFGSFPWKSMNVDGSTARNVDNITSNSKGQHWWTACTIPLYVGIIH